MNKDARVIRALPPKPLEGLRGVKSSKSLSERAGKKTLDLFHKAADHVPAYKAFLKSERINHTRIKTMADFSAVPFTDAKNYITSYSVAERCWDGDIASTQLIATSSGTTGEPKFWPRSIEQDVEAAMVHEFLYQEYFNIQKHSTLFLIGFPMGVYISGVATLLPTWLSSLRKYKMTVMSIGNNKKEMLRAVEHLSRHYDQTILIGHPFFIKDVIESGVREGIVWEKKNIGLMFCSEGFSEEWRDYVAQKAGIAKSSQRVFNTYGSSEMLLMGYETPFSIKIKRLAERNADFLNMVTGNSIAPQFFQYNPLIRYIESINRELIFSSASGIPLIRFNLHDQGEVFSFNTIKQQVNTYNNDTSPIDESTYPFPLIALWGRTNDTVKVHGANIYPEHIKSGLMDGQFMALSTGKFVIRKFLNRAMDQRWEINIELSQGSLPSKALAHSLQDAITQKLLKVNLEYLDMSTHIHKDVRPRIILWPYQHDKYFKPGVKPRYIHREK